MAVKVSIILPVYNQEDYLENALSSVSSQTYSDIEIIIVNDGSTDASLNIAEEFSVKDGRVKIISQENCGLLVANVTGIREATGDYVCFYDPDDRIGPDYISSFVCELDAPYDFVARGITYLYPKCTVDFPLRENRVYFQQELRALTHNYILSPTMTMDNAIFIARWNKMYKASLLRSFVDKYEECKAVSLGEDTIFTYLVLQHAKIGKTCVKPSSYCYVQHDASMTHSVKPDVLLGMCDVTYQCFSKLIDDYMKDHTPAQLLFCSQVSGALASAVDEGCSDAAELYSKLMSNKRFLEALECAHGFTEGKNLNIELLHRGVPFWFYRFARKIYRTIKL